MLLHLVQPTTFNYTGRQYPLDVLTLLALQRTKGVFQSEGLIGQSYNPPASADRFTSDHCDRKVPWCNSGDPLQWVVLSLIYVLSFANVGITSPFKRRRLRRQTQSIRTRHKRTSPLGLQQAACLDSNVIKVAKSFLVVIKIKLVFHRMTHKSGLASFASAP